MKFTPILAGYFLALISLIFVGCGKTTSTTTQESATSTAEVATQPPMAKDKFAEDTALSNPATVYCLEQGGKFTMGRTFDGSSEGYCTLPSNITCEVWAHYNGDCPVGSKKKKQTETSTKTDATATTTKAAAKNPPSEKVVDAVTSNVEGAALNQQKPTIHDLTETHGLTITAEPGEDAGEIITRWNTNGLSAPEGFIVMLSGQEQVSYPTKYFHILRNPSSRSFIWNDLVPGRTYFFRVCIKEGNGCKTYSAVANSLPK